MKAKPILKGLISYFPGMKALFSKRNPGPPVTSEYCYGVFLKHLAILGSNGLEEIPEVLIEFGPGGTFGVGIAALLTGTKRYYALDVVRISKKESNFQMVQDLAELLKRRAPRPRKGWPDFDSHLDNSLFPYDILPPDSTGTTVIDNNRVERIQRAIADPDDAANDIQMEYIVPWNDHTALPAEIADLIISHSVMEHVMDIEAVYTAMFAWLKPGGFLSHQIDFRSHGTASNWNGYWAYSDRIWRLISGRLPYLINRKPCSAHISTLSKLGFDILCMKKRYETSGIEKSELNSDWKHLSDDDLKCSGVFIQARKR